MKIICSGLNYIDTILEPGDSLPQIPLLFLKPESAIIGDGEAIVFPKESRHLTIEAELAVVMGRRGKDIPKKRAWEYIRGCCAANDVTARDIQKTDGQWTRAKSFDSFLPLSRERPVDAPFSKMPIRSYINGILVQDGDLEKIIFDIPYLVHYISKVMTLEEGDIILTGTPGGYGKKVEPGDTVTIEIPGIGTVTNNVSAK